MDKSLLAGFLEVAELQVGKPYEWGTAGPTTFDCSGLVWYCINAVLDTPLAPAFRSSHYQYAHLGTKVEAAWGQWQRGDLLFFDTMGDGAGHVGIFTGDGMMVNALNEGAGVTASSILQGNYWRPAYLGTRRLFTGGATTPTGAPNPLVASTVREIGPMTPFRSIGDVSLEVWRRELANTPITDVDASYAAASGYTALALTQAIKESSLGTAPGAREAKNPLGLLLSDGRTLQSFASWPLAFAEFRRRLTDPSYKGLPGPYFPPSVGGIVPGWDMSLLAYLITYVGGPRCLSSRGADCANGETYDETKPKDGLTSTGIPVADDPTSPSINRYTAQTLRRLRTFLGISGPVVPGPTPSGLQRVTFAGSTAIAYLPDNVQFRTILTPVGNNRPGNRITVTGTTQHETGNTRRGTGSLMHSQWQDSGTPGHPDGYVGVHFYVDDDLIVQKIPVNEDSIHSGDWRNDAHISVERCVNSDQTPFAQSEANAAALQAALLKYVVKNTALNAMYPHRRPGTGSCPVNIGAHWSQFEQRVDQLIRELP